MDDLICFNGHVRCSDNSGARLPGYQLLGICVEWADGTGSYYFLSATEKAGVRHSQLHVKLACSDAEDDERLQASGAAAEAGPASAPISGSAQRAKSVRACSPATFGVIARDGFGGVGVRSACVRQAEHFR